MVSFAVNNIELGTATDPVEDGDGAVLVNRVKLSAESLEVLSLSFNRGHDQPFDLFHKGTRVLHQQCWIESFESMRLDGRSVVIAHARIQYTSKVVRGPGGLNPNQRRSRGTGDTHA